MTTLCDGTRISKWFYILDLMNSTVHTHSGTYRLPFISSNKYYALLQPKKCNDNRTIRQTVNHFHLELETLFKKEFGFSLSTYPAKTKSIPPCHLVKYVNPTIKKTLKPNELKSYAKEHVCNRKHITVRDREYFSTVKSDKDRIAFITSSINRYTELASLKYLGCKPRYYAKLINDILCQLQRSPDLKRNTTFRAYNTVNAVDNAILKLLQDRYIFYSKRQYNSVNGDIYHEYLRENKILSVFEAVTEHYYQYKFNPRQIPVSEKDVGMYGELDVPATLGEPQLIQLPTIRKRSWSNAFGHHSRFKRIKSRILDYDGHARQWTFYTTRGS